MSEKKRTTVTTIETHEVWIIRRVVPEPHDATANLLPGDIDQPVQVLPATELINSSANDEEEP